MEKGVFPENLPPVFKVSKFYSVAIDAGLFEQNQIERNKPTALARYNETKRGNQRRVFSTPNPLFFIDTANFITKHRRQLNNALSSSPISHSKPEFDGDYNRAIKISTFAEFVAARRAKLSTSRYIVKTDISRFFPSIYTHSIPWAVHGKRAAKLERSAKSSTIYTNELDYLIRQAQDQQTVGIPIGPDVSRIISELIAGAIDADFIDQVGPDVPGARLVDDIYIGADTLEEAENYLSAYRDSIRKFELDINESKTRIFEARQDLEAFWPVTVRRELKGFQIDDFELPSTILKSD
ncbi:RNA-directed DNA polymerase [Aquisalinus flavus]|nr:RNA-directed DNA polymerase [Aquisalinus flavus]MBD0425557.1 RNA-directed DNA polymerase [Aquisalinus flavus]